MYDTMEMEGSGGSGGSDTGDIYAEAMIDSSLSSKENIDFTNSPSSYDYHPTASPESKLKKIAKNLIYKLIKFGLIVMLLILFMKRY